MAFARFENALPTCCKTFSIISSFEMYICFHSIVCARFIKWHKRLYYEGIYEIGDCLMLNLQVFPCILLDDNGGYCIHMPVISSWTKAMRKTSPDFLLIKHRRVRIASLCDRISRYWGIQRGYSRFRFITRFIFYSSLSCMTCWRSPCLKDAERIQRILLGYIQKQQPKKNCCGSRPLGKVLISILPRWLMNAGSNISVEKSDAILIKLISSIGVLFISLPSFQWLKIFCVRQCFSAAILTHHGYLFWGEREISPRLFLVESTPLVGGIMGLHWEDCFIRY